MNPKKIEDFLREKNNKTPFNFITAIMEKDPACVRAMEKCVSKINKEGEQNDEETAV